MRWLHSPTAGVDKELSPRMLASDVVLTSSAGNGGIPLAEHSMLLMLMLNRNVPRWIEAQRNRTWDRFTHGELNGLTVGIIGLGNAGADLALKAQAFHMRVLGLRRRTHLPTPECRSPLSSRGTAGVPGGMRFRRRHCPAHARERRPPRPRRLRGDEADRLRRLHLPGRDHRR